MQHTITTPKVKWLLVEVPDNQQRERVGKHCNDSEVRWQLTTLCNKPFLNFYNINESKTSAIRGYSGIIYNVELPPGEHELIATTSTITEDQAAEIVELSDLEIELVIFKNYQGLPFSYDNAIASFRSLLQANQIPTEKVYVIIKIKD